MKKLSEIHLKIQLKDINEKVNLLMNNRNKLIAYASENYPHIDWTDSKAYDDSEMMSIIKSREIILN